MEDIHGEAGGRDVDRRAFGLKKSGVGWRKVGEERDI